MGNFGWSVVLIIHGLIAVFLVGALLHQAASVCWPNTSKSQNFVAAFRGVNSMRYTNTIIILFITVFIFGSFIYPFYRVNVRIPLERIHFQRVVGTFELKEHFLAIAFGMLPAYWYFWRQPLSDAMRRARTGVTAVIAFAVLYAFIAGHILNNARGFGS
ncbi:MAG TPA: hypothetical protein VL402_04060 [Xanthobacteraceae bacterium]|jgi:hypothetical protein|nr:hypothetical protein [Xanthobacteraceae bacterium]